MRFDIHLRDTLTGATKIDRDDFEWQTEQAMLFQWIEGNYSCDCNRGAVLYDEDPDLPCSPLGTNRIVIDRIANRATGQEVDMDLYKPIAPRLTGKA